MRNRSGVSWWRLLMISGFCTLGCPGTGGSPTIQPLGFEAKSGDPEAEKRFHRAREHFETGDIQHAEMEFEQFAQDFDDDPLLPQVQIYRGRIAIDEGRYEDAKRFLNQVIRLGNRSSSYDYAQMYMGVAWFRSGNSRKAISVLGSYADRFTESTERFLVLDTLRRASGEVHDYEGLAVWTARTIAAAPPPAQVDDAIAYFEGVLDAMDNMDVLLRMTVALEERSEIWARILRRVARLQYEMAALDDLVETMEEIGSAGKRFLVGLEDLLQVVERRVRVNMETVGCLLPLSGSSRVVGQSTLQGVMLGAKRFRFGRENAPLSVVIRDTGGDPRKAVAALEDMVNTDRVSLVIGPMDAREALPAARKAKELGVPILLLSTDSTIPSIGRNVFRRFATMDSEVDALVSTLSEEQQRVAVLYPDNAYGRGMLASMTLRVEERQGTMVSGVSFSPQQTDFGVSVRKLEKESFDVLFLPLTAAQLALAAPALAAVGIWSARPSVDDSRVAVYLIPSIGFAQHLVSRAGRYLQGARFVLALESDENDAAVRFWRDFQDEYKTEPTVFSAYGYDAVLLVAAALRDGVTNRRDLIQWLQRDRTHSSVMPFSAFDDTGDATPLPIVRQLWGERLESR